MSEEVFELNGTFVLPQNFTPSNYTTVDTDPHEHVVNVVVLFCIGLCVFVTLGLSVFMVREVGEED
jgi:hypothetical protein